MRLKSLEVSGFKSFGKKEALDFNAPISSIVGPNGSGKSNIAEAFRFVLGEQSIKSLRGKKGEDLIFNGGKNSSRANRAAVKVVFDNANRLFNVDYDEVQIERVVHRDGVNQYFINGTLVRLRDIAELLAEANIGASGHHIISQGEADRLLSASSSERREMIEDALGLRSYQFKLKESEKKLSKTHENIGQVEALRKEIAPHLRFLKKQVEKVEKTRELREELAVLYRGYLKREDIIISSHTARLKEAELSPRSELERLEVELTEAKAVLAREHAGDRETEEIIRLEGELRVSRERGENLLREQARLEGEISFEERRLAACRRRAEHVDERSIPLKEIRIFTEEIESAAVVALGSDALEVLKESLQNIITSVRAFVGTKETEEGGHVTEVRDIEQTILDLQSRLGKVSDERTAAGIKEGEVREAYEAVRKAVEAARVEGREAERRMFSIVARQGEIRTQLERLAGEIRTLEHRKGMFENELKEGSVLIGRAVLSYADYELAESPELISQQAPHEQEARRKALERMKIRLEELGSGSGDDVMKEFREIEERDQFLAREIEDLQKSAASLKTLIVELEVKLDHQFKEGITKINKEFQTFFALMFGGGTAALALTRETPRRSTEAEDALGELSAASEESPEEGIDISISLPHKRIKGLVMLSGGERALTSIALLFAMSQVNPPPFLILDETDAALDEANSRRYGDMIENLAKYSQLILITHNRETMSRAQILYGVTMGGEGISKILSVRFEEALAVAK